VRRSTRIPEDLKSDEGCRQLLRQAAAQHQWSGVRADSRGSIQRDHCAAGQLCAEKV